MCDLLDLSSSTPNDFTHVFDDSLQSFVRSGRACNSLRCVVLVHRASDLQLRGPFVYVQVLPTPSKYFTMHFDVVTKDGSQFRVSVSNLYTKLKVRFQLGIGYKRVGWGMAVHVYGACTRTFAVWCYVHEFLLFLSFSLIH